MSYYQKYRPRKIEELDLDGVREIFLSVLKSGNFSHAYLLVGPRGAGKTSAARILAQAVNCKKNGEKKVNLVEPCGECENCKSILKSSSVDILEMDAASHRSIDDVRDLRSKIRLSPVSLKKKVYIIDEVHMLTNEAFNALLKTLEEPPAHAMFFLCTTEAHKVPETIISRCARINFTRATTKEIVRSLSKAVSGEGLEVFEGGLELVAEAADGSFREGHKLLEQLASRQALVNEELARSSLGLVGTRVVGRLVELSVSGQPEELVRAIKVLEEEGVRATILLSDLLAYIRVKMEESMGGADFVRYARLIDRLVTASEKVKYSPIPILPIELALLSAAVDKSTPVASTGFASGGAVNKVERTETKRSDSVEKNDDVHTTVELKVESAGTTSVTELASIEKVKTEWDTFLSGLAPKNQSIAGLLRSAMPKYIDGRELMLEVFYPFHKSQLEQDSKRKVVEEAVAAVWGPMNVRCVLGEKVRAGGDEIKAGTDHDTKKEASVEEIFG